ncbi:MAG: precorrin-6A/cobalt-precorrin-6A reductase [Candidatus Symbiobacter sp.]|nr:precorrin-6A/cobalt-precorrin-6A reductase [Candidatus Symbiobacter sp.]
MKKILILGGTAEGRELVPSVATIPICQVTYALAGILPQDATQADNFTQMGIKIRRGGFGGVDGLCDFIRHNEIDAVIDATHPFAQNIGQNALQAARLSQKPWAKIWRVPWLPGPGANWHNFPSLRETAEHYARLRQNDAPPRRLFLGLGGKGGLAWLKAWRKTWQDMPKATSLLPELILMRSFVPAPDFAPGPPLNVVWRHERDGPDLAGEYELLRRHEIDLVITRNSGGIRDKKLQAAQQLGCQVWMIDRPDLATWPLNDQERRHIFPSPNALLASQWLERV